MEVLIYPIVNGLAHISTGMAVGRYVRRLLKLKNSKYREGINLGTDAFLGISADVDILVDFLGSHRGYFHIPYVEALYGGAVGFSREGIINKKFNVKNMAKNALAGGAAAASHFILDIFSGGEAPLSLDLYINLHEYLKGQDNIIYHLGITAFSTGLLLYMYHKDRKGKNANNMYKKGSL